MLATHNLSFSTSKGDIKYSKAKCSAMTPQNTKLKKINGI